MARILPFVPRHAGPSYPRPPLDLTALALANKMQLLVLLHPVAAGEVIKLVDRLLTGTY